MRVRIRVDASERVGGGHVGRCLALAEALAGRGAEVRFLTRADAELGRGMIAAAGFGTNLLETGEDAGADADASRAASDGADWIVVDHYGFDALWHHRVLDDNGKKRILVIDDLADRPLACDLLVDYGRPDEDGGAYRDLLQRDCRMLLGPRYALLRREFRSVTKGCRSGNKARVLVFFGAVDRGGRVETVLDSLKTAGLMETAEVHVIVTAANPRREAIRSRSDIVVHENVADMAQLLAGLDIAVGAGGVSLWERCAVGLPGVAVAVNENQAPGIRAAVDAAAARRLSVEELGEAETLAPLVSGLLADTAGREEMAAAARRLVDGRGAERVAEAMAA